MKNAIGSGLLLAALWSMSAGAEIYELPPAGYDVIGAVSTVTARHEDTLVDIARRHGLGYLEIVRANPDVNAWVPGEGTEIVLPTRFVLPSVPREGLVLNLAEYRLYYFPKPKPNQPAYVMTYPISIGRMDWETPLGKTKIIAKQKDPSWYPPQSVRDEHAQEGQPLPRIVPPGPDNPLGGFAMRLALPGYLIHGTNKPAGVGMRVSHGCIRMFPEDIEYLFGQIGVNTPVRIINEPVKLGWEGDSLVMEMHPVLDVSNDSAQVNDEPLPVVSTDADQAAVANTLAENIPEKKDPLTFVTEQFVAVTGQRAGVLDWKQVEKVIAKADGIPVAVGKAKKNAATSAAFE